MSKIQTPKKIRVEDFDAEQQELIRGIGFVINPFMDEVYLILTNNIDFNNLNRELVEIDLNIDSSGNLINLPQIKNKVISKVRGINILKATNLVNPTIYPSSSPFLSWSVNGDILNILNVTGLQNSSQYRLLVELVG